MCSSSPGSSSRQPGSSSIRSLAMITAGWAASWSDRARIRPLRRPACASPGPGRSPPAGGAFQHVELVGGRVAQRPQLGRGGQHQVERVQRQLVGDPADGATSPAPDVAAVAPDLRGDQGEHPLAVGLAAAPGPAAPSSASRCVQLGPGPAPRRCGRTTVRPAGTGGCWPRCGRRCWRTARAPRTCVPAQLAGGRRELGSCQAAMGCLSTIGRPSGPKHPMPAPSGLRWLCAARLSGASSSQNSASATPPACKPNNRHTARSPPGRPAVPVTRNRTSGEHNVC